jgi:hypothetical protein
MPLLRTRRQVRHARWAFLQVFFPVMAALAALFAALRWWGA